MVGRKVCLLLHDLLYDENAVREPTWSRAHSGIFFFFESGSPVHYKAKNGLYPLSARTAGRSPMLGGRHLSEMVTVEGVRLMKSMSSSRSGA